MSSCPHTMEVTYLRERVCGVTFSETAQVSLHIETRVTEEKLDLANTM